MAPQHQHRHHGRHVGRGRTNFIYPAFADSEPQIIVVDAVVEEEKKLQPHAVNGFFDFLSPTVQQVARVAAPLPVPTIATRQFFQNPHLFTSASHRRPQVQVHSPQVRKFAQQMAQRAYRMPGVKVAPYFSINGDFEGYVAKDSVSGVEIGCCMVAGDTVEISGIFDFVGKAVSSVGSAISDVTSSIRDRAIKPVVKAVGSAASTVGKGIGSAATFVGKNIGTAAFTAVGGLAGLAISEIKALAPVKKFVTQNAGIIGAGALAVAFPPAGAVAIAALAAQMAAKGAKALGANTGFLGTITDIVDTAGGVVSLNPQKLAETAGRVGGMIGKAVNSQALIDAGASVEDIAAATRGDPQAIARLTGVAGKLAGKVTGMKEFADAGAIIAEGSKALKGDTSAIASLTSRAAGATGINELKALANTIQVAGNVIQGGKIVPGKMASEALRLASPQAYAQLQKIDPRLLTNEGIHKLAELAKKANPAEAAKLMQTVTQRYQNDVTSSVNALINNARSADPTIRNAALKAVEATRKLAAFGNQDAQRAAQMLSAVNTLQVVKDNVTKTIPAIKSAPNGGTAIFIARNGTSSRGRFVRDPKGQPGVLVDKGQKYAGFWRAI